MKPGITRHMAGLLLAACLLGAGGPAGAQLSDDLRQGYEAYKSGQFADAAAAFGRAIDAGALDPEALAVTLNNRGVAYSQLGNYDAAIADYLAAQKLKADDPTTVRNLRYAYLTRGLATLKAGDRRTALADYDRALAIDPNYLEALQYRGALRAELGMTDEATSDFRQVLALEPGNAAATAALAALAEPAPAGEAASGSATTAEAAPEAAPPDPSAPDAMETAVERSRSAEERAQASLDEALEAARAAEPTAAPEPEAVAEAPAAPEGGTDAVPAPTQAERPAEATPAPAPAQPAAAAGSEATEEAGQFRISTAVNLRGGPDNSFPVVGVVPEGTLVRSDRVQLGWHRLPSAEGRPTGWVYRRFLIPAE